MSRPSPQAREAARMLCHALAADMKRIDETAVALERYADGRVAEAQKGLAEAWTMYVTGGSHAVFQDAMKQVLDRFGVDYFDPAAALRSRCAPPSGQGAVDANRDEAWRDAREESKPR